MRKKTIDNAFVRILASFADTILIEPNQKIETVLACGKPVKKPEGLQKKKST